VPKTISKTTKPARRKARVAAPSLPYEDWLIENLKDRKEAAAYLEAAIEDGDQAVLMLALRHVALAQGGVAEVARRANLTREATYKMLSKVGNPALSSLTAVLAATGLRLSVKLVEKPLRKEIVHKRAGVKPNKSEMQAA
jgi:probable addiction module antidote protein